MGRGPLVQLLWPWAPAPVGLSFVHNGYCMGVTSGGEPESSEDVDYLAALITHLKAEFRIPENRTIMSGYQQLGLRRVPLQREVGDDRRAGHRLPHSGVVRSVGRVL